MAIKSKYGNVRVEQFDSKVERDYGLQLMAEKAAGHIKDFIHHQDFDLIVEGKHICYIEVDFLILHKNGSQEVREVKSPATKTAVWSIKKKLFEAIYPHIKYNVIMRDSFHSQKKRFIREHRERIIQI